MSDDSRPLERFMYKLWLKPFPRPRGDQTEGGTVLPGITQPRKKVSRRSNGATAVLTVLPAVPTAALTTSPTTAPTASPTAIPTAAPTSAPTVAPTTGNTDTTGTNDIKQNNRRVFPRLSVPEMVRNLKATHSPPLD
jgi:hypothetical protein